MTSIGTKFYTWRFGQEVGRDSFGNVYYVEKSPRDPAKAKRWVVYAKDAAVEASAVPPEWHAWLHPNLTGTPDAYRPPGHDLRGGKRAAATGDYEAWTPGE